MQIGLSAETPANKLAGDALFNFGGFLKRSWRANDILWGRLDASGAIVQTLLDRDRLVRILAADSGAADRIISVLDSYISRGAVCEAVTGQHLNDGYQGDSYEAVSRDPVGQFVYPWYEKTKRQAILDWLQEGYKRLQPLAACEAGIGDLLDAVLMRHQVEILHEEVPQTIAQAISEHAQWEGRGDAQDGDLPFRELQWQRQTRPIQMSGKNEPPTPPAASPLTPQAERTAEREAPTYGYVPDAPVDDAMQAEALRQAEQMFSPQSGEKDSRASKVYAYFRDRYAIGQESVADDIPMLVSLRRVATLLLVTLHVLRNCIADSPEFESSSFGKLLVRGMLLPLMLTAGAVYGFITLLSQGKRDAVAVHAIAWTVIVLGVLILLLQVTTKTTLVLLVVLAALFCEGVYWWARDVRDRSRRLPLWLLVAALCVAAFDVGSIRFPHGSRIDFLQALYRYPPLIRFTSPKLAWGWLLAGTLFLMFILGWIDTYLKTPQAPAGIVSFELAGSRMIRKVLASWDQHKRRWAVASLLVDFLYIPLYTTTIGLCCAWLAQKVSRIAPPAADIQWLIQIFILGGYLVAWLQWLAGVLDVGENIGLLATLITMRSFRSQEAAASQGEKKKFFWPDLAAWCASRKFWIVGIGLVYILFLIVLAVGFKYGSSGTASSPRTRVSLTRR